MSKHTIPDPARVGLVGCGNISDRYFRFCRTFVDVEIVACADLLPERARAKAAQYGVRAPAVDELLDDPDIDIVLNLTIPEAHAEVDLAALEAGKHVYSEKPLALDLTDGQRVLATAAERGLRVGCAPDTFLGGGQQTSRKLIDEGWIGRPVAAVAFLASHGHEHWHPDPTFYYKAGGGPMLDMGPYYITALVNLLGPVARVSGSTRISFPRRRITSEPKYGEMIDVEVSTHQAALLEFAAGLTATVVMSFDVWSHNLPRIEVYGTEGSLVVPDPNNFRGPVLLRRADAEAWSETPLSHSDRVERSIGVADMASAIRQNRPQRVSGELALHVLEVMLAVEEASAGERHVDIASSVARPKPLPLGLQPGRVES
ncbi:MAG: Gfo/Idh/MocA family oxidoreductase [Anaerolineaceae bacterium]|nr:Gfo/Idh/MocA family oxidoreductase [Anaerolineaceae bacterium]